jgi:chromate transporter
MTGSVGIFEILVVILLSSLFSIGGGNGPIAVIQNQWVTPGILDPGLFAWAFALSSLTPGPRVGFISGIGYYLYGFPGALAAVIGIVVPTCIATSFVSYGYSRLQPIIKRISLPAGFIIAGMIAAAAWGMLTPMNLGIWEILGVAGVAVLVGWKNVEPLIVVLGSAGVGLLWWFLL